MASDANPAADAAERWDFDYRPKRIRRWAIVAAVVILLLHIAWGATLTTGRDLGVYVGIQDQVAYAVVGLIFAALVLLVLRIRVRAGAAGVEITGLLGSRVFPWDDVVGFTFPVSSQWARLELPAYEHAGIQAIQANDRDRAVEAMQALRGVARRYKPSAAESEAVADR